MVDHEKEAHKLDDEIDAVLLHKAGLPQELEHEIALLKKHNGDLLSDLNKARTENANLRYKLLKDGEDRKRWEAKAGVSKAHIRDLRYAIKGAIISIRDLARRRPNEVTAEHLSALASEAEILVQYTSLPR
jgi:predicted phosphoribosyltransferase